MKKKSKNNFSMSNKKVVDNSVSMALLFSLFILIFPIYGLANIYSSVQESTVEGNGTLKYKFSIDLWDENGGGEPNPCYGRVNCWIKINHVHSIGNGGGNSIPTVQVSLEIGDFRTINEVRTAFLKKYSIPILGSITHSGLITALECVGFFYGDGSNVSFNDKLFPTSFCGIPPPPHGQCSLQQDNSLLEHGDVSINELINSVASQVLTVHCDNEMVVKVVSLSGPTGIDMGGGLRSLLYINEEPAGNGVNIKVGPEGSKDFVLKSKLTADSLATVLPGEHTGSTALVLVVP